MGESTATLARGAKRFAFTITGYASTVIISAGVSLAIIPVIIAKSGEAGWAAIAVGQSVGSIAAIVTALGWSITGPALIARASPSNRGQIVANSVVSRLWMCTLVFPLAATVTWLSTSEHRLSAVFAALNVASVGLGLVWYFVGTSSPRNLLLLDTLPRASGTVIGGVALWFSGSLEIFAAVQLISACIAVLVSCRFATKKSKAASPRWVWSVRWAAHQMRQQVLPSTTALATSLYGALPTLAVAWFAPSGIATYALAERLGRYVTMAVTPIHNWMQGWVPAAGNREDVRSRIRTVVSAAAVMGIFSGVGLWLLGPILGQLLGGGSILLEGPVILGVAVAVGMTTLSRCTGSACLIAMGAAKAVAFSSFAGAFVCIIGLSWCVSEWGAAGAAISMAAAETTVVLYQGATLFHIFLRDMRKPAAGKL